MLDTWAASCILHSISFLLSSFHKKEATLVAETVCGLLQSVGGWWEEGVDLTPCSGATPLGSNIREICTCGSMRGRRSKDHLLLCDFNKKEELT